MSTFLAVFKVIFAFFTMLPNLFGPIPAMLNQAEYFENWSVEQVYTRDYAIELEKDPQKDFVILNLTDIQLIDLNAYDEMGTESEAMIKRLVDEQKPDLITLTGDNAWGMLAYIRLVDFIDSFGIPWAPVMGNHDGEYTTNEFWCSYLFEEAENCLWKFGPKDMGYGNYIINITENDKIIHTLFMMDTHSSATYKTDDGNEVSGYDHLWDNQIQWYTWAVEGIEKIAQTKVESSVFIHIPVYEMRTVYNSNYNTATNAYTGEYTDTSFGVTYEAPCVGVVNNHFMDVVTELGSTKNIIFGHDHNNNSSILYNGVRLTYGMKLGKGCYYHPSLQGGTVLKVDSAGKGSIEHINYGE